jgi:diguanylate cyclase (GGDEF)-like protein
LELKALLDLKRVDELTGVYNRIALMTKLQDIAKAKDSKLTWCLIQIDIDNFKMINDKFGHAVGDNSHLLFSYC